MIVAWSGSLKRNGNCCGKLREILSELSPVGAIFNLPGLLPCPITEILMDATFLNC